MAHREMTRSQAESWRQNWSLGDVRRLAHEFDRLGATTYYEVKGGSYFGCRNSVGARVMYVAPGYVWFPKGCEPPDKELPPWNGYALSTFNPRSDASPAFDRVEAACPLHNLVLPATGVCDDCE